VGSAVTTGKGMSYSAPLELLTDISGSITFGWADEGVYYARFTRCLSARLGSAFAARLREAVAADGAIKYFADGRALESYDLLARSAFVRVVTEHRSKFEQINILAWADGDLSPAYLSVLGDAVVLARDEIDFEARLLAVAPRARNKLGGGAEPRQRSRWSLRR
jgi:hypothetical protein